MTVDCAGQPWTSLCNQHRLSKRTMSGPWLYGLYSFYMGNNRLTDKRLEFLIILNVNSNFPK